MSAAGGPTNQSGIGYQDAIVAIFLGRMLDPRERPPAEAVTEVRNETTGDVDDIEIVHGDGAHRWLQAKEAISTSSSDWSALWISFERKRTTMDVARGDRLALWLGSATGAQRELEEAAFRARGARDADEWWNDLSKAQQLATQTVTRVLGAGTAEHGPVFELLRVTDIEVTAREHLTERIPYWVPPAKGMSTHALFDVLQARSLEAARQRIAFTRASLIAELRGRRIEIIEPSPGEDAYRRAIENETAVIRLPGTALRGATKDVFFRPRMRLWTQVREREHRETHDLDEFWFDEGGERVCWEDLPGGPGAHTVIMAGAGGGKSTLLGALANHLAKSQWTPFIVRLIELATAGSSVVSFLEARAKDRYSADIPCREMCDNGTAIVLFDGLDELTPRARSTVSDAIQAFSARFPETPWIMTVRDSAGTTAPADARIVELLPLRDDDIESFCAGWLPTHDRARAASIGSRIKLSRELRRMARIPFLLALMLERAVSGNGEIPSRRSELLESYISALLRPEKRKSGMPPDVDPISLRATAEHLAFTALDKIETDFHARDAIAPAGVGSPQQTLDALQSRGLIRELRDDRYAFTFPILQEYLAGFHLATTRAQEILERFELAASRPWMQTLQFALEISPDADALVQRLLLLPDDAFRTNLKIIARCIGNGARVSTSTQTEVGDRLAAHWISEERHGHLTGFLLADGFAKALPVAARERIVEGKFDSGSAEIVVAAQDPILTEEALRGFLKVRFPGHTTAWQAAVDAIAPRAARILIDRAAAAVTPDREREVIWIAYLLAQVATAQSSEDPRHRCADDESIDLIVRLACHIKLGKPLTTAVEPLAIQAYRDYVRVEMPNESPMFGVIMDTVFRLPRAAEVWRLLLSETETTPLYAWPTAWWLFALTPAEAYWRTLMFAAAGRMPEAEARTVISQLKESGLSARRNDYVDIVLAYLNDDDAFQRVGERLDKVYWRDVTSWAQLANNRPPALVAGHLAKLKELPREHRHSVAHSFGFSFSHEIELMGLTGGARGRAKRLHGAAPAMVVLLKQWAAEAAEGSRDRFHALSTAINLGAHELIPAVLKQLDIRLGSQFDFNTDTAMSEALTAIADSGTPISFELLVRAARASESNLHFRAATQLERLRTRAALDVLLELHASPRKEKVKDVLARHVESLARALGVRIAGDPKTRLVVSN